MLAFMEGKKLEKPKKNLRSKAKTNNKLNPRACMAVVVGERFHLCAIPAPLISSGNPSRAIFRSIPVLEIPGESRNHVTRVLAARKRLCTNFCQRAR